MRGEGRGARAYDLRVRVIEVVVLVSQAVAVSAFGVVSVGICK